VFEIKLTLLQMVVVFVGSQASCYLKRSLIGCQRARSLAKSSTSSAVQAPAGEWILNDMYHNSDFAHRLIAIMLGRLEMSVDECIEKHKDFMKKVFAVSWRNKVRTLTDGAKYDETVLESCIKEVVKEKLGNEDAKLLDDREEACKV
jgi:hypothetical protein